MSEPLYKHYFGPAVGNIYTTELEANKITMELIRRGVITEGAKPTKQLVVVTNFDTFFAEPHTQTPNGK